MRKPINEVEKSVTISGIKFRISRKFRRYSGTVPLFNYTVDVDGKTYCDFKRKFKAVEFCEGYAAFHANKKLRGR